jgi:hypothetical protein
MARYEYTTRHTTPTQETTYRHTYSSKECWAVSVGEGGLCDRLEEAGLMGAVAWGIVLFFILLLIGSILLH